jgi:WD40 repeat protein
VWDAANGQELLNLKGHEDIVSSVAWSPGGKRLASASKDGTVLVYALDIRELLDLARKRVTRNLSPDECQRYFQSETCPPLP